MLTELIAKLEAAVAADRNLDREIYTIIFPHGEPYPHEPARFTSSLDAALTLIPEGLYWLVGAGKVEPDEPLYGAQILRTAADVIADGQHDATAALALAIAALKARRLQRFPPSLAFRQTQERMMPFRSRSGPNDATRIGT
jgi:hypothetical protein